jgi:hypothetical protein
MCDCDNGLRFANLGGLVAVEPCPCGLCDKCDEGWIWDEGGTHACACLALHTAARLISQAHVPARYGACRLDTFPTAEGTLEAWGAASALAEGEPLWFHGKPRVGKTGLLIGGLFEGCRRGRRYLYASWIDVVGRLRLNAYEIDAPNWERLVAWESHLVLDAIGPTGRLADGRLVEIVRRRSDRLLPISVASRLTPKSLNAKVGGVIERLPSPVRLDGPPLQG